jgi:hypothetical protein
MMTGSKKADRWEMLEDSVREYPLPEITVQREYFPPMESGVVIEDLKTKRTHRIDRNDNFGILLSGDPETDKISDKGRTVIVPVSGKNIRQGVFIYKEGNKLMVAPSDAYLDGERVDIPRYVASGSLLEFGGYPLFSLGKIRVRIHHRYGQGAPLTPP